MEETSYNVSGAHDINRGNSDTPNRAAERSGGHDYTYIVIIYSNRVTGRVSPRTFRDTSYALASTNGGLV